MRVAFLGNDEWSVAPLRALVDASDIEVELVVTNPPRPAGRGSQLTATAVADEARTLELPLLEVDRIRDGEGFDALDSLEPDAIVVVAYGEILTPDVLDIPRLGAVNVHFCDGFAGGELHFDYTMRPGVVPHGNGLALMRAVGLKV